MEGKRAKVKEQEKRSAATGERGEEAFFSRRHAFAFRSQTEVAFLLSSPALFFLLFLVIEFGYP